MRASLLICDHAALAGGKLYINGGGWTIHRRPGQMVIGLALRLWADWHEANRQMPIAIRLMDEDGQPVILNDKPVEIRGTLEFGRPVGIVAGDELTSNAAFNLGVALAPGSYRFELDVDGQLLATERFRVASAKPPA